MIPGYVAGHYTFRQCHIDLCKLATFAQADLVHAAASHIDVQRKQVHFEGRPPVSYDCLSVDVGITPRISVPGLEHVTPVKPIDGCAHVGTCVSQQHFCRHCAVIASPLCRRLQ
jgi:selenide, water dikinase